MEQISVGAKAPEFSLKDQDGNELSLSGFLGKRVLLSFHPLAWTGVCQRQMEALEMNVEALAALNAQALGISVDAVPTKKAWADAIGVVKTRLLSDFWPHGGVASAFGLFREDAGTSERATVLIDESGVVRWIKVYPLSEVPDIQELLATLKTI
jgi:peroxiredoxin